MSAKREFNLFTQLLRSTTDCEAEDSLTFQRHELSRDDPDGCDIGLSIDFTTDNALREKEDGFYEIFRTSPAIKAGGRTREKVDRINIAYCIDNTDEIRDLADWLMTEADNIDEELEIMKEKE